MLWLAVLPHAVINGLDPPVVEPLVLLLGIALFGLCAGLAAVRRVSTMHLMDALRFQIKGRVNMFSYVSDFTDPADHLALDEAVLMRDSADADGEQPWEVLRVWEFTIPWL